MAVFKVLLTFGLLVTASAQEPRPTRTLGFGRFLGLDRSPPQQQPQPQPLPQQIVQNPPPLVYNVKYYDRAGENPEVQVEQANPQQVVQQGQERFVPSTRVFLNLYTGQQTPVYYDSKGQLYVPCPTYDHHHVHSAAVKPVVHVQKNVGPPVQQQGPVPAEYVYYSGVPPVPVQQQQQKQAHPQQRPPVPVGVGQPVQQPYVTSVVPDYLYYATPQQQQAPKVPVPSTVVAYNPYEVPYGYPYLPSPYGFPGHGHVVYPNGGGPYVNPFVYVKPAQVTQSPVPSAQPVVAHVQQQTDHVVVEKKNVSEKSEQQQQ